MASTFMVMYTCLVSKVFDLFASSNFYLPLPLDRPLTWIHTVEHVTSQSYTISEIFQSQTPISNSSSLYVLVLELHQGSKSLTLLFLTVLHPPSLPSLRPRRHCLATWKFLALSVFTTNILQSQTVGAIKLPSGQTFTWDWLEGS